MRAGSQKDERTPGQSQLCEWKVRNLHIIVLQRPEEATAPSSVAAMAMAMAVAVAVAMAVAMAMAVAVAAAVATVAICGWSDASHSAGQSCWRDASHIGRAPCSLRYSTGARVPNIAPRMWPERPP